MIPQYFLSALALVFVGAGGLGASDIAIHFDQPLLAAGYALGALAFLGTGFIRLVRAL